MVIKGKGFDDGCFEVKPSNIVNAGQGLFTRVHIPGNCKIIEATGTVKPDEECNSFRYCFDLGKGMSLEITNMARKANDAYGTSKHNNARWYMTKDREGNVHVWLVSNRPIAAGAEILVDYGKGYWETPQEDICKASRIAVGAFTSKAFQEYKEQDVESGEEAEMSFEVKQILDFKKIGEKNIKAAVKALKQKRKADSEIAEQLANKKAKCLERLQSRAAVATQ